MCRTRKRSDFLTDHAKEQASERLILDNLKLTHFAARRVLGDRAGCKTLYDDCVSVATEYLCLAARSYDPQAGCAFSTWALIWMRGALLEYLHLERLHGLSGVSRNSSEVKVFVKTYRDLWELEDALWLTDASCDMDEVLRAKEQLAGIKRVATASEMAAACLIAQGYSHQAAGRRLFKTSDAVKKDIHRLRKKARTA